MIRLLTLGLILILPLASASWYEGCEPVTSIPEIDTGPTPAGHWYVDHDVCQPECPNPTWVYEESNGIDGLQRNDEMVDDTCGGVIASDRLALKVPG